MGILQFIVCIAKHRGCTELFNATPMYDIYRVKLRY